MAKLTTIIDRYYRTWFRFHPELAVDMGVSGYEHLLKPYGDDEIGALNVLNEKLISSLDELETDSLSQDQQIDMQLLRGEALREMEAHALRDWRTTNPVKFLPVHAIYQLTVRDVHEKEKAFTERLQAIPAYLRGARTWLSTDPSQIPRIWMDSAIAEAEGGAAFFRELKHHPDIHRFHLESELEQAAHALDEFAQFMQKDLLAMTAGEFACGREFFELILREQHFLDVDADALHEFGQGLFNETQEKLKQVTIRLQGNDDTAALNKKIQANSPKPSELLTVYREQMQAARQFVIEHDLVSLPNKETLKVIETPVFLQHQIPFAAYYEPSPSDTEQKGIYYVTQPGTDEEMGEHNLLGLKHTCVHEAWPGHHLQFVKANIKPTSSSLPRLINTSATLYEGWALYCEQLMHESGFIKEAESEFVLLKDRLWRALRIMLDVELHTRGLSVDDAAERMQKELGFTRSQALADLSWYTQAPGVPMGYATGWAMINALKARQSAQDDFSLKAFHDNLLSVGSVALPLVIVRGFGLDAWQHVRNAVFN